MRVVTTCHKAGWEQYGHRLVESWKNWPRDAELWFYTEGFSIDRDDVTEVPNTKIEALQNFKNKYGHYQPVSYLYDVVRFSNKVYAACDALMDYKGLGVWLDADCVTYQPFPDGYIESLLPKGAYIALFKRAGMYSETGFWVMDCSHPQHQAFLSTWMEWYESGMFKHLGNWTDCETLDATIRKFEKAGQIVSASLSGEHAKDMHPMSKVDLARYVDHRKGARKVLDHSPENKFAAEAFAKNAQEKSLDAAPAV